jgi:mannose-6-phosphate isomerase-like protein (cupin superfamily)
MPVYRSNDFVSHAMHDAEFSSYVTPARDTTELCAWRVKVAPGSTGVAHQVSRDEVLLVLSGQPQVLVDTVEEKLEPGDVIHVPAGRDFRLDNPGAEPASLWVTTSVGLTARLADGSEISPPWASA